LGVGVQSPWRKISVSEFLVYINLNSFVRSFVDLDKNSSLLTAYFPKYSEISV